MGQPDFLLPPQQVLYVNGLERTEPGIPERLYASYMNYQGFSITHAEVDWYHDDPSETLREELRERAESLLSEHGRLAFVAASAGVSLSVAVFEEMRSEQPRADIALVGLSGWTRTYQLEELFRTAMRRPGKRPSVTFFESVLYCEQESLAALTPADKARMRTVHPLADKTVPIEAMGIEGVKQFTVPVRNHLSSIALGAVKAPHYLQDIYARLDIQPAR